MQNRYKIYPDIHFGISKLSPGVKTIEELLDLAEKFRKEKNFHEVHFQLNDMRNCRFDFEPNRIQDMIALIDRFKDIDNQKLGVYLVDQPIETAYVELFSQLMDNKRAFCSTIEKAFSLLSLPISFENFKLLISI